MKTYFASAALLLSVLAVAPAARLAAQPAPVNEISAELGRCSAQIKVVDINQKPVYSAKISTRVQYGLMGVKRLDLEAFTDHEGQVRISGLPDSLKKPVFIRISKQGPEVLVEFKPEAACHAQFNVVLP